MQKGENLISFALAAVVVLTTVAIQRHWRPTTLTEVASSAEEFILSAAGMGKQVPDIVGYEKVQTYRLGRYRAGLYRASPAPLVFAAGWLVIYDSRDKPVFKLATLEGSKDPWTTLYNFAGRNGLPIPGRRARAVYTRDLTGNGQPDIVIGQYSGGDHCCTTATVVELGKESVKVLGRINGLDGLPFEGLELRRTGRGPSWAIIAHRPYRTLCGTHQDAADVLSVYSYGNGQYTDQTPLFSDYLNHVLKQNLAKWSKASGRSLALLQTLAADFARVGQQDEGKRFFATNLPLFIAQLQSKVIDANACMDDVASLLERIASSQSVSGTPGGS